MMRPVTVALLLVLVSTAAPSSVVPPQFDCAARNLALEFAARSLTDARALDHVADALRLGECPDRPVVVEAQRAPERPIVASALYVDSESGSDLNRGTLGSPLQTLHAARDAARAQGLRTIYCRRGRYYLSEPLTLGPEDSGLTIEAYQQEEVVVSGGVPLRLTLTPSASDPEIFEAAVEELDFNVTSLFEILPNSSALGFESAETRLIWAREPNGHPERDLQPDGYALADGDGGAPSWPGSEDGSLHIVIEEPRRNSTVYPVYGEDLDPRGGANKNWLHLGGTGVRFVGAKGFWNGSNPTGLRWNATGGVDRNGFNVSGFGGDTWTDAAGYEGAVAHVFHNAFWGNWQFYVCGVEPETRQLSFCGGGFQEGRGGGIGVQPFFVEGAREALDSPGEWWYNRTARLVSLIPNTTSFARAAAAGITLDVVAPRLQCLVDVRGAAGGARVRGVTLRGLTFAHAAATNLEPYEVPSPGDWSIHRGASLFVEGADDLTVEDCKFIRVGGNAVFLSGAAKRTVIRGCEFAYTGDSAIASVGSLAMNDGFSVDTFPDNTTIVRNHFREIGVTGKQAAAYFSALSCRTTFEGNVAYNGPRAGVNFNDGFCGGHSLSENLLFNFVRETQDHGPFNSWNRAAYVQTDPTTGLPTTLPSWSRILRNFIMNGPSGNRDLGNLFPTIDHDDGSAFWDSSDNFLVYGGAKNYLGDDKQWRGNLLAYPDRWNEGNCAQLWGGVGDHFRNNTCITLGGPPIGLDGTVLGFECKIDWDDPENLQFVANASENAYYLPGGEYSFECGDGTTASHNFTLEELQAHGLELGTRVRDAAEISPGAIIAMARAVLGMV